MFGIPRETAYDVKFRLFGIPFRIHPLFWAVAVLFSPFLRNFEDFYMLLAGLCGWILAWMLTFTIHELGHALVIKYVYGANPAIIFYGFGGLTVHQPFYKRIPSNGGRMLISFAGPLAQLSSTALLLGAFWVCGVEPRLTDTVNRIGPIPIPMILPNWLPPLNYPMLLNAYFYFMYGFIWMGIAWSVLNLLPIYPLDGGQIVRSFCQKLDSIGGVRTSLWISIICAIAMLAFAFRDGNQFIAIFFGIFAFQNFQELNMPRRGFY